MGAGRRRPDRRPHPAGVVRRHQGAYFRQYDARPTGTGHIQSFLRVQGASSKNAVQHGYNTDARPLQFDENKSPQFTRSLRAADLPEVDIGGVKYKEFLLDVNQKSSQPYLSLDRVQIFVGGGPGLTDYDTAAGTLAGLTPVYDMDAGEDHWVKLDYRLNTGSGSGDMLLYVRADLLPAGSFVYLYSRFGEHHAANAGFQEWARGVGVPLAVSSGETGGLAGTVTVNGGGARDLVVYIDANGNGVWDADTEAHDVTDEAGGYRFDTLLAGPDVEYRVRVVGFDGYEELASLTAGEDTTLDIELELN